MPGIMPFIGRSMQEAQDKFDMMQSLIEPRLGLGLLVVNSFPDYTGYDLDGPVPDLPLPAGRKSHFSAAQAQRVLSVFAPASVGGLSWLNPRHRLLVCSCCR